MTLVVGFQPGQAIGRALGLRVESRRGRSNGLIVDFGDGRNVGHNGPSNRRMVARLCIVGAKK